MSELAALNSKLQSRLSKNTRDNDDAIEDAASLHPAAAAQPLPDLARSVAPAASLPAPAQVVLRPAPHPSVVQTARANVILSDTFMSPASHRAESDTDSSSADDALNRSNSWTRTLGSHRQRSHSRSRSRSRPPHGAAETSGSTAPVALILSSAPVEAAAGTRAQDDETTC